MWKSLQGINGQEDRPSCEGSASPEWEEGGAFCSAKGSTRVQGFLRRGPFGRRGRNAALAPARLVMHAVDHETSYRTADRSEACPEGRASTQGAPAAG
jgi:hypothetical protein